MRLRPAAFHFLLFLQDDEAFRLLVKHLRQLLLLPDGLLAEQVVADERRVVRVDANADAEDEEKVAVQVRLHLAATAGAVGTHFHVIVSIGGHFGGDEHG